MNNNIKVRKWNFDSKNPNQTISPAIKESLPFGKGDFYVELIEIETDNPCDLIIVLTKEANGIKDVTPIYLYQYRENMIFQNGRYIFKADITLNDVAITQYNINVIHEQKGDFKLTAYLSLIQI